jgi:diadenosine tetraphosphatase ApaH/serine/threonine PP2A family protein phosphatase
MYALISDIHSNVEALTAVFADMAAFGVQRVLCLGDVIGYGPQPRETLELVRRCEFILLGNHEEGLLDTICGDGFNDRARKALEWTRDELNSPRFAKEQNYGLWDLIDTMQTQRQEGDVLYVHASPRQPVREYVMPADALDRTKMADIFGHMATARICFGGHTHVPGIFTEGGQFRHQSEFKDERVALPKERCLVNIGSVGQPRDGDNRACYVIVDGDFLQFRRVAYDIPGTMRKIQANPALDDFLARRLKAGQ